MRLLKNLFKSKWSEPEFIRLDSTVTGYLWWDNNTTPNVFCRQKNTKTDKYRYYLTYCHTRLYVNAEIYEKTGKFFYHPL